MQLHAWNSSLTAKKSWFMFDNEIVCLGAGITSSDSRTIETIIENRRLGLYGDNLFTVNGAMKPALVGWSETNSLASNSWVHLAGTVPGADLGYFFPQPATVKALREARSGSLGDINTNDIGTTLGTTVTRNYLTLWFDHGANPSNATYAYVLLPNQTAVEVADYAANPDVVVIGNSTTAQGVRESTLGITAVNFWKDGTNRLGGIIVDRKASVIMRNDGSFLDLGISDPTQTNSGIINLELANFTAINALSYDQGITVVQTTPTIKLAVNVNSAGGQTFRARFFVAPAQPITLSPVADAYVENGTNAFVNFGSAPSLVVKTNLSSTNLTREAYLRFQLPPAPGIILNATLRMVPISPYGSLNSNALALVADNSWAETNSPGISGIVWTTRPASGPALTNWVVPTTNTPVLLTVTAQAQQAAAGDGKLSFRLYPVGTNTAFSAYASKENGSTSSWPQLILNLGPVPPTVVLTNPADGSIFDAPASFSLAADAQDPDGSVTNVDFYNGFTRIAQSAAAPYTLTLSNLGPGKYTFAAVATDLAGLASTSAPVTVSVYNPEPVGSGTGLWGEYFLHPNLTDPVDSATRIDPTVNFSWPGSPGGAIPADNFSVRWTGQLQARHAGTHVFHTVSDDGVRLWVNGELLINNWTIHTATEDIGGPISLQPGQYYDLQMEFFDNTGPAVAQLYWTQPGGTKEIIPQTQLYPADSGLRGQYYPTTNLTKTPAFTRIDDVVNFSWGKSSPDPTLLPGGFSVQWKGKVRANEAGTYTFYTISEDGVTLTVNNQSVISNWTVHASTENSGSINLAAGQFYPVSLRFFHLTGEATAVLMWTTPTNGSKQVIPEANLTPHQDNSPPALSSIPNTVTTPNRLLTFAAVATDADLPNQSLTFSLDPGAPAGASINPTNGLFAWTPAPTQALGNYSVTVRVSDNGTPVMTDAQTFTIALTSNYTAAAVSLVPVGALWRYLDSGVDQGSPWRVNGFNDAGWKSGLAQLGYGTGHEATLVSYGASPANKYTTTYFRRAFFVPDASLVESLSARLFRDDGAVVYLNGTEVWRDNLPAGLIAFGTMASSEVTGSTQTNFITNLLSPVSLVNGTNIIAIEIHQASPGGPDIGFDFELTGVAAVPAQAALGFTTSGGTPVLRWPQEAGLLQLYTTTNLSPPVSWVALTNTPALSNNQWVLPLPAVTNHSQFYRLQSR